MKQAESVHDTETPATHLIRGHFRRQLEQLQVATVASDQHLASELKKVLAAADRQLTGRFEQLIKELALAIDGLNSEQEPQVPATIDELVHDRAGLLDMLLEFIWNRLDWQAPSCHPMSRVSLLAVGGYGRGELHPGSDVDLLILLNNHNYDAYSYNVRTFTTLLWDIGLKVSHSVRSVADCLSQADADLSIMTSLMETRTLAGAPELRDGLNAELNARRIWSPARFFAGKQEEQLQRDSQWEHTIHNLEPNLKTSPGGLRYIQTIFWIAKKNYGTDKTEELIAQGFLTGEEAETLQLGRRFLWLIRYALHEAAGRGEDRLGFDYQRQLAALLGYQDTDLLAVEQFMRQYYRTVTRIRDVNELVMQFFHESALEGSGHQTIRPINERFRTCNEQIEVVSDDVFERHPSALLEMFLLMGNDQNIRGVRAATLRLLRGSVRLIDENFRRQPQNADLFMRLLGVRYQMSFLLRRMAHLGILGAYLPEFGRVAGQMQFDLFHIYTVDAHTLQVVRKMRSFRYRDKKQKFPVAAHILPRLPKIELLYIAGLYHDLAKGRGGDHSQLGVLDVAEFARRHQLADWDTRLVCWLVRHHLVMSWTAQRRDISDPEVIREFALFVGDQVHLDYLYTLTVADINATNPTLWNSWRASLMWQLYSETKRALRSGLETLLDREPFIQSVQSQALQRLEDSGVSREAVLALWEGLDGEYFICEPLLNIVWHAENILRGQEDKPLILMQDRLRNQVETGCTCIFIHMQKERHLFSTVASTLDQLNVVIVDSHMFTNNDGHLFTTFIILEQDGQPLGENRKRRFEIVERLRRDLRSGKPCMKPVQRHTPSALQQFQAPTEINTRNTEHHTMLTVVTPDRPGLLALISQLLLDLDVQLRIAKITTLGERVEDVFYLVDDDEGPLRDEALLEKIKETLCRKLDEDANALRHAKPSAPGKVS